MKKIIVLVLVISVIVAIPKDLSANGSRGAMLRIIKNDGQIIMGNLVAVKLKQKSLLMMEKFKETDGIRQVSPDGKMLSFGADRCIYIRNVDGSEQKRLTNNPGHDWGPLWSPDWKKIVFESTRDGNYEIYIMNPDGSEQTNLTNNPADDLFPSWSPFLKTEK